MNHLPRGVRRASTLAVVVGLGLTLLSGCGQEDDAAESSGGREGGGEPSSATDPQPAADAATWLSGQLTGGLVRNDQYDFDDVGLSIDVALAADAAATSDAETIVSQVAGAVGDPAVLTGYVGTADTGVFAGATGKAAVLAEVAEEDPAAFGGVDLVSQLEGLVATEDATAGRVADTGPEDYANVISQAYAVWALGAGASPTAADATAFLLTQQCADGWFRASFAAPTAPDQACDGDPASAPDVDTTALAVLALTGGAGQDPEAAAAVDLAVDLLVQSQADDGSFAGAAAPGADAGVPNANSTGLAGWALGEAGETEPAAEAAAWLGSLQVPEDAAGKTADDAGAVAYDQAALEAGESRGIVVKTSDQWRRATAQALPALAYTVTEGS